MLVSLQGVYADPEAGALSSVLEYAEHDLAGLLRAHRDAGKPMGVVRRSPRVVRLASLWLIHVLCIAVSLAGGGEVPHVPAAGRAQLSAQQLGRAPRPQARQPPCRCTRAPRRNTQNRYARVCVCELCRPFVRQVVSVSCLLYRRDFLSSVRRAADFGLARLFASPLRELGRDGVVVTLWYRAPELLLGSRSYTRAVDMWAAGCILAELVLSRALFQGDEVKGDPHALQSDQLLKIFEIAGTPRVRDWPELAQLPHWLGTVQYWPACVPLSLPAISRLCRCVLVARMLCCRAVSVWCSYVRCVCRCVDAFACSKPSQLRSVIKDGGALFDLLRQLLEFDPRKRITAARALQHEWFAQHPLPRAEYMGDRRICVADRGFVWCGGVYSVLAASRMQYAPRPIIQLESCTCGISVLECPSSLAFASLCASLVCFAVCSDGMYQCVCRVQLASAPRHVRPSPLPCPRPDSPPSTCPRLHRSLHLSFHHPWLPSAAAPCLRPVQRLWCQR